MEAFFLTIHCRLIGGGNTVLAETVKSNHAGAAVAEASAWGEMRLRECSDPDARVECTWTQLKQFALNYRPENATENE